jgi:hypothetical protein
MVSGEIADPPLPPKPVPRLEADDVEAPAEKSNGLLVSCLNPVDCADDFDEVSA